MPKPKKNWRKSEAPRPYERRATNAYPYFRAAWWDPRSFTYRDNASPHATVQAAIDFAKENFNPGKIRITTIGEKGPVGYEDFVI